MIVIDRLKAWLTPLPERPPLPPLDEVDAQMALAALLVRVAKADHVYLFEELEQIDRILAKRNALDAVAAAKMRAQAERVEAAFADTPHFAHVIREAVPYADRHAIVDVLWQVVLADGIEEHHEVALVHLIEAELGVEPVHSAQARAAAEVIR